ncbi:LysR family transcriptional regulator [Patulibacter sp.]|uniref:LysR family transcriptional regulator n=1 Tax=Patulibacter sp. TaxID=1912859 RepID=UPI00271B3ACA|nr:LysR family transcriptional regulator [Patulibacter sp.]MDO9408867.1 LysR family transcriptional regulator [Patulibacter sp.]
MSLRAPPAPLNIRQVQYFVAVVDEASFTRAAEALLVSQPALSHQVRALEDAVGAPLIERTTRPVSLTPAGRALLPAARSALDVLERGRRAARSAAELSAGELCIAVTQSLAQGVLPRVLRDWRSAHPAVQIRVREHTHLQHLHADLAEGRADVALAQRPADWTGALQDVGEEELVVVLGQGDPLAGEGSGAIDLGALAARSWVLPDRDNGLSETVELACSAAGFVPRPAVRSGSVSVLVQLAAAGLGPTLVPANVLPDDLAGTGRRCAPALRRPLAVFGPPSAATVAAELAAVVRRVGRVDP